ncbi:hypothetical protein [Flavobacterium sp. UBA4197]|nr:hypothetical protein [Flavobacterium sp. UBA4197]
MPQAIVIADIDKISNKKHYCHEAVLPACGRNCQGRKKAEERLK